MIISTVIREELEGIANRLELIARLHLNLPDKEDLIKIAWDIKQVARKGTAAQGI